jgi:hypothetical protein
MQKCASVFASQKDAKNNLVCQDGRRLLFYLC